VTNNRELCEKLYLLRNHWNMAQTSVRMADFPTPEVVQWAWKSRLDNIQAALLNVKFKYYKDLLARRKEIADMYCQGLKDLPLKLPTYGEGDVIQEFIIRIGSEKMREEFKKFMDEKGIEILIRETTPNHKLKNLYLDNFSLPVTESISKDAVRLPAYPELTNEEVNYIIEAIREFYSKQ
jgi:dTDP-4-amino-4,6-dideoxygalactose transaminase